MPNETFNFPTSMNIYLISGKTYKKANIFSDKSEPNFMLILLRFTSREECLSRLPFSTQNIKTFPVDFPTLLKRKMEFDV